MHDRRYPMLGDCGAQPRAVGEVAFDQRTPAHRLAVSARQIVVDDRQVSGLRQRLAGVRPDIAGAAGDEN